MQRLALGVILLAVCGGLWTAATHGQSSPLFTDVTAETGLDFHHRNGAEGGLLLPEVIGAGGALFDFDNDGDLDLFAVQSGPVPGNDAGAVIVTPALASLSQRPRPSGVGGFG